MINQPFWGNTPIYGHPHIDSQSLVGGGCMWISHCLKTKTSRSTLLVRAERCPAEKRTLRSVVESYANRVEQELATRTNAHFANYLFSIESGAKELGGTFK